MTIDPIFYYTLLVSLIVLVGVIVALSAYVLTLAHSVRQIHEHVSAEDESTDRVRHILKSMYAKALGRNAHAIEEVLASEFKTQMQKLELEEEQRMQQMIQTFLDSMSQGLIKTQQDHIKTISNVAKNIEQQTMQEIELFKKTLSQETVGTQQQIEAELKKSYQEVLKEIDAYKQQKLKAIDEQIFTILNDISKDTLGKSLSLQDHQQLLMASLKKAKQEGFFES